jgi:hypothetical protein
MAYAKGTTVSVSSSQMEIAKTLERYKVHTYSFGARPGLAMVEFELTQMPIRVAVPLPEKPARQKGASPETGRTVDLWIRWEQDVKECWRALLLLIKANLEAIERGIVKAEEAFMAYLLLPEGRTVGDVVLPAYHAALKTGLWLAIEASS